MKFERASGILLHPTSLPGPYGIGEIGPAAREWIDFISQAGCSLWQVLPLGPTGYGDSPYQSFSTFAGNPYLISLENLLAEGLLEPDDLAAAPHFPADRVDFGSLIPWKLSVLDRAFDHFQDSASQALLTEFESFKQVHSSWLEDFSMFMAFKEAHGGGSWVDWPVELRSRSPLALAQARQDNATEIERQRFRQFIFYRQWAVLRAYAAARGIRIIGDVPIFVAHDSAEVWARPELFYLDESGNPTHVAGVPPDYFSRTGQLWGNPLYRWEVHAADGFGWWLERLRAVFRLVDIVRVDHFRGFAGYWEVPAGEKTAERGRWATGPGAAFFQAIEQGLGELPILAEDLGVITPDVVALRETFNLPGMRIIQFGFHGDPQEPFLLHNHVPNSVIYTGTHDNDTSLGWYQRVPESERDFYRRYLGRDGSDVSWDFIRAAWSSVSMFALAPMQDFLELDNQARMNYPGNPSGNWSWRMSGEEYSEELQNRILEFNFLYDRMNPIEQARREALQAQEQRAETR